MTPHGDLLTDGKLIYFIFIVIYLIMFIIWLIKKKSLLSHIVLFVSVVYLHLLFVLLFLPIPLTAKGVELIRFRHRGMPFFNITPFKYITMFIIQAIEFGDYGEMAANIFGNILCFMPFGFLLPCLDKRFFDKKKFLIAALTVPVCVELTQLAASLSFKIVYRFADIDDVMLNFTGALIGFDILSFVFSFAKKHKHIDFYNLLFKKR